MKYTVILFYKFIEIEDPEALRDAQRELCESLNLKGRILIAKEGINGTVEGDGVAIRTYREALQKDSRFSDMPIKKSEGSGSAFPKLKIKVRDEVVTLGAGYIDPAAPTAPELTAEELHQMYDSNEAFVLLDLRNDYEIASGAFENTVDPGLRQFRDLPRKLAGLENLKDKKVVTVCTGGIRCEKATKLMAEKGFANLYQLKDGIHTYMKKFPGSHFKGTLYVFDNRMVTDVEEIEDKEVIGRCQYCDSPSEQYYSDDSKRPSIKVICCTLCYELHKDKLREAVTA